MPGTPYDSNTSPRSSATYNGTDRVTIRAMAKDKDKMSEPRSIRFPHMFLDRVEEWRAKQRPIPPWGDAIRQLAEMGLGVAEKAEKPVKGKKP